MSATYIDTRTTPSGAIPQIRQGRVQDNSLSSAQKAPVPSGVPQQPFFLYSLSVPAAANDTYYYPLTATGTSSAAHSLTLAHTAPRPGSNGLPVARNVTATMSGNISATLTITGTDIQGRAISEVITYSADDGLKFTVKTFASVLSAVLDLSPEQTSRNLSIGFGNVFGLPYPFYSDFWSKALYDIDGADFPNTSMSTDVDFIVGDPTDTAADHLGTVMLGADNEDGAKTPDGIASYAVAYLVTDTLGVAASIGANFVYQNA